MLLWFDVSLLCHHRDFRDSLSTTSRIQRKVIIVKHITRVKASKRLIAVPVMDISRKYLKVDVSSGIYVCLLPNPYEKDWFKCVCFYNKTDMQCVLMSVNILIVPLKYWITVCDRWSGMKSSWCIKMKIWH